MQVFECVTDPQKQQVDEVAHYFLSLPIDERPTAIFCSPLCERIREDFAVVLVLSDCRSLPPDCHAHGRGSMTPEICRAWSVIGCFDFIFLKRLT